MTRQTLGEHNGFAGELVKRLEKAGSFLELDSIMDEFTHFSNLGRFTIDEKNKIVNQYFDTSERLWTEIFNDIREG